jgi:hypothetical protein
MGWSRLLNRISPVLTVHDPQRWFCRVDQLTL